MRLLAAIFFASAALCPAAESVAGRWEGNIGAIFSTPLVVNGVVYFGSTEGDLYALE